MAFSSMLLPGRALEAEASRTSPVSITIPNPEVGGVKFVTLILSPVETLTTCTASAQAGELPTAF